MIAPKNPGPMEHKGVRLGIRLLTGAMPAAVFPDAVRRFAPAKVSGFVHAVKYYPAGATTHSENGVTDLARCRAVFAAIEKHALPLLMHGEVTDPIGLGHDHAGHHQVHLRLQALSGKVLRRRPRVLFEELRHAQRPKAMVIACCDSRADIA